MGKLYNMKGEELNNKAIKKYEELKKQELTPEGAFRLCMAVIAEASKDYRRTCKDLKKMYKGRAVNPCILQRSLEKQREWFKDPGNLYLSICDIDGDYITKKIEEEEGLNL